jgi:hypothetical protein
MNPQSPQMRSESPTPPVSPTPMPVIGNSSTSRREQKRQRMGDSLSLQFGDPLSKFTLPKTVRKLSESLGGVARTFGGPFIEDISKLNQ